MSFHPDRRRPPRHKKYDTGRQCSFVSQCHVRNHTLLRIGWWIPLLLLWCTLIIGISIVNSQRSMDAVLLLWPSTTMMMMIPPSPSISENLPPSRPKLRLRYDYTHLERTSALANDIAVMQSQQNCSLTSQPGYFWYRNRYGLGSDLHVFSVAICNALQMNSNNNNNQTHPHHVHVQTLLPWIWYDQDHCDGYSKYSSSASSSAMTCYFPESEPHCPVSPSLHASLSLNLTRPLGKIRESCPDIVQQHGGISALRTATTEFLFTRLSHLVQMEGERQLNRVFVNGENINRTVPPNLITVHIRWGDKADEMELVPIEHYVNAVRDIVQRRRRRRHAQNERRDTNHEEEEDVHIYVATEDPDAVRQFQAAAPTDWHLYLDQSFVELSPDRSASYNGAAHQARGQRGRPGLSALGSLLVAMEANDFVLTTSSNWSRLMNEIRISILHPRCRNCTTLIDLNPGEW